MPTYEVPDWDFPIKVTESGTERVDVSGEGSLETALKVHRSEDHDLDGAWENQDLVVAGPHWRGLPDGEKKAVEQAAKKHFSTTGFLHGDDAYKNLTGEWPPWNPQGEGFE